MSGEHSRPLAQFVQIQIGSNCYNIAICGPVCQWPRNGVTLEELLWNERLAIARANSPRPR